jgi:hypothetical protein
MGLDRGVALVDGDAIPFRINLPGFRSPEVLVYWWSRATLDDALRSAGFERIRWIGPELSPQVDAAGRRQFQDYIDRPLCVVIERVKR